ncbi:domain-containing, mitochondrial-like [Octopus vulgaris]|uniref:Threonylcarbamoyl-AMP synthase n=1 Tax=Octopus vulgaris TaxID=6645 RepID=A0AA36FLJ4_OCTVU|nr:domain-containing, mitochondrial-like [Octopus vulgaris]
MKICSLLFSSGFKISRVLKPVNKMAKIIQLDTIEDLKPQITIAAKKLLSGGVIAVPTDTIYGIACLAQNKDAVDSIYKIKKRNPLKPIAISIADVKDISKWCNVTVPISLLHDLLPGPVTLVFQRSQQLNEYLNPDTDYVGIRIPDHSFIRGLARTVDGPIALTSANISDQQSPLSIKEFENLWPELDIVCDGGTLGSTVESRQGSTVVDLSVKDCFKVLRDGSAYENTTSILKSKYQLKEIS